jgi:hypothetical protein
MDRKRAKRTSSEEWKSPVDDDAEITKLKDGRTALAYKAENAVDMETGAIVAVTTHGGTAADTNTLMRASRRWLRCPIVRTNRAPFAGGRRVLSIKVCNRKSHNTGEICNVALPGGRVVMLRANKCLRATHLAVARLLLASGVRLA